MTICDNRILKKSKLQSEYQKMLQIKFQIMQKYNIYHHRIWLSLTYISSTNITTLHQKWLKTINKKLNV